jgi:hypothetical protein
MRRLAASSQSWEVRMMVSSCPVTRKREAETAQETPAGNL